MEDARAEARSTARSTSPGQAPRARSPAPAAVGLDEALSPSSNRAGPTAAGARSAAPSGRPQAEAEVAPHVAVAAGGAQAAERLPRRLEVAAHRRPPASPAACRPASFSGDHWPPTAGAAGRPLAAPRCRLRPRRRGSGSIGDEPLRRRGRRRRPGRRAAAGGVSIKFASRAASGGPCGRGNIPIRSDRCAARRSTACSRSARPCRAARGTRAAATGLTRGQVAERPEERRRLFRFEDALRGVVSCALFWTISWPSSDRGRAAARRGPDSTTGRGPWV